MQDLEALRHSTSHVMAQAVLEIFPDAKLAWGGQGKREDTKDQFYYDFELPRSLTQEDLEDIELRMRKLLQRSHLFVRREVTITEARRIFAGQTYKVETIDGIEKGEMTEHGEASGQAAKTVSLYTQDTFTDLCHGPHIENTSQIRPDAFKILNVSGAYWRGDVKRPMLQRVKGTVWPSKEELDQYFWRLEEIKKRDHRILGEQLDFFSFHEEAPGAAFWHPKGTFLLNLLVDFSRAEQAKREYLEIRTPNIVKVDLWKQSGHYEFYKDKMYVCPMGETEEYGVKPMNCPESTIFYRTSVRSYKELPLRVAEYGTLARYEDKGELHGLLRVRQMLMDDTHIFCAEDQIPQEVEGVLELIDMMYTAFGFPYAIKLSTRPEKAMGDIALWDKAEKSLEDSCRRLNRQFALKPKEGAFYGPKLDFDVPNALGRPWQLATVQLDFQMPERFGLEYIGADGKPHRPVMIHRAIYGTLERFVAILLEFYAGALPVWLSPVQAVVIPITERHSDYARQVSKQCKEAGLRVEVDERHEKMEEKIREAQVHKTPYMLIAGDKEATAGTVDIRLRTQERLGAKSIAEFIAMAQDAVAQKRQI